MASDPEGAAAEPRSPIGDFSQCHLGILAQLDALGRLPALLGPAAEARHIAAQTIEFFRHAVLEHHAEEERELFPAVLASATKGDERVHVQSIVDRLTVEHRQVESAFGRLEPALKAVAKGHDSDLDAAAVSDLVARYRAHAGFEETEFLPLAQKILSRNSDHMAALGLSLHLRHSVPEILQRYGSRI
jgi:hypothetical protein